MNTATKYTLFLLAGALLCGCSGSADRNTELTRAEETVAAIYSHYSVPGNLLLRENWPTDNDYKAGYLASEASGSNPYSYLWPFSGSLSAVTAIMESAPEYADTLTGRVLPGLEEYLDTGRSPAAYSSYINSAPESDRFYDDNIWLGIDFTDLYSLTGDKEYLDNAEMIWKFIESGTDDVLGGGIYWCEQKKHSKNTCSNAPGAVFALKLHLATGEERYFTQGRALYDWTFRTLRDTTDNLYFDNINLEGKITEWKFAYNSGQMIQAGVLLYSITGDKTYLEQAQKTARACHDFFFEDFTTPDGRQIKVLKPGNTWFHAVMVRGLAELYKADGNPQYIDAVKASAEAAWRYSRTPEGLFNDDCSGRRHDGRHWLLTQWAMAEIYARLAALQ